MELRSSKTRLWQNKAATNRWQTRTLSSYIKKTKIYWGFVAINNCDCGASTHAQISCLLFFLYESQFFFHATIERAWTAWWAGSDTLLDLISPKKASRVFDVFSTYVLTLETGSYIRRGNWLYFFHHHNEIELTFWLESFFTQRKYWYLNLKKSSSQKMNNFIFESNENRSIPEKNFLA